ncbi:MAG TPA: NADH-quinone oxidoreductase subunit J [Candidatus Saccharimonadales bacterium]|jgi:NADH-quinone oxidoreductase subunit J|nr:NADH-quinone oxidoreductase subunit J [Candidatus Saccharimonadales bacterium]
MLHEILFLFFAAICVGGAINLVLQRHPINSALSLVVVMVSLAALYLLLGAEFVGAVQVIVYAGAIMVLFVFVIMLLNAGAEEQSQGSRIALLIGGPGVALLAGAIMWLVTHSDKTIGNVVVGSMVSTTGGDNTHQVARLLFKDFLLPFEVTSILILIAIMGAVVLASRKES